MALRLEESHSELYLCNEAYIWKKLDTYGGECGNGCEESSHV